MSGAALQPLPVSFFLYIYLCNLMDCRKNLNILLNLHTNRKPEAVAPCFSFWFRKKDTVVRFNLSGLNFVSLVFLLIYTDFVLNKFTCQIFKYIIDIQVISFS